MRDSQSGDELIVLRASCAKRELARHAPLCLWRLPSPRGGMAPGGMRQLLNYEHGMDASDGTAAMAYVGGACIAALFGESGHDA